MICVEARVSAATVAGCGEIVRNLEWRGSGGNGALGAIGELDLDGGLVWVHEVFL